MDDNIDRITLPWLIELITADGAAGIIAKKITHDFQDEPRKAGLWLPHH
jgi:hypothetical protein